MQKQKMRLIIVSGLPGSGKSTISEGVASKLRLPVFSVDPIESAILKTGMKKSFKTGLAAYEIVGTLAEENLKLGQSVIIDAVSPVLWARKKWKALASKYKTRILIIECVYLDKKLYRKRIEARVRNLHGIREVMWKDIEKIQKEYLPWKEKRLVLDGINNSKINIDKAIKYIKTNSV